jgi:methylated-DNA-[protein]-cysteine S-methyltransferase
LQLFKKTFNAPVGDITVICNRDYIINLSFGKDNCDSWLKKYFGEVEICDEGPLCHQCEREIASYFSGNLKKFETPFKLYGTAFQLKIWNALLKIPYGKTATYAGISEMAGAGGARAAGGALSQNPIAIIVPCHRIIRADGTLGGFCSGFEKVNIKRELLTLEGAFFIPS